MSTTIIAPCEGCGIRVELSPPNLPATGGTAMFQDDRVKGWQVLWFTCGPCWAARRTTWTCPHCGDASHELAFRCRGCGREKPGLAPYEPDWDLIGKEVENRRREAEALAAEWDREYPGWRAANLGGHERF